MLKTKKCLIVMIIFEQKYEKKIMNKQNKVISDQILRLFILNCQI